MKKLLLGIVAIIVIGGGIYFYNNDKPHTSNIATYNNLGISFQYPVEWGTPKEDLSGRGFGSISFDTNSSSTQSFNVFIAQDTDPQGGGLLSETLDQMIARFRANDQYIYDVKNISANGIQGKELFYNSAVTGKPYHVQAYFPFHTNSYVSLGADYESVSQSVFDSIISSFKWDNTTDFKQDPATGMAIYRNNGIRFEYPIQFNTEYASLNIHTSVEKLDTAKLNSAGCYQGNALTTNGTKFCVATTGDVGAGQLYTAYDYMTSRNGNAYTIVYLVHTSNGCGAYEDQRYNECLNFKKNYDSIVVKPIQQSISTFSFTK